MPATDFLDGAGWIEASALDDAIPDEADCDDLTLIPIALLEGSDPPTGVNTTHYTVGLAPTPDQPEAANISGLSTYGRKEYVIAEVELEVGQRVRASIAWNACATSPTATGQASPAIDLDLLLYNATDNRYVYGSHSVDDVNEGFDHLIEPRDQDATTATYHLVVSRDESDTTDCGGATTLSLGAWVVVL